MADNKVDASRDRLSHRHANAVISLLCHLFSSHSSSSMTLKNNDRIITIIMFNDDGNLTSFLSVLKFKIYANFGIKVTNFVF